MLSGSALLLLKRLIRVGRSLGELERKAQAEREARQRQELKQFKELLNQAKQWKQAELIREYLAAMQNADPSYLAWAECKADWLDPLTDIEDEWLNEDSKNNL
jgi:hypothetical protein